MQLGTNKVQIVDDNNKGKTAIELYISKCIVAVVVVVVVDSIQ